MTKVLVPGCGGTEKPFRIENRNWLYCYHPASGKHCYLNLDTNVPTWDRRFHPSFSPEFENVNSADVYQLCISFSELGELNVNGAYF